MHTLIHVFVSPFTRVDSRSTSHCQGKGYYTIRGV
jgi:hypothetical protein